MSYDFKPTDPFTPLEKEKEKEPAPAKAAVAAPPPSATPPPSQPSQSKPSTRKPSSSILMPAYLKTDGSGAAAAAAASSDTDATSASATPTEPAPAAVPIPAPAPAEPHVRKPVGANNILNLTASRSARSAGGGDDDVAKPAENILDLTSSSRTSRRAAGGVPVDVVESVALGIPDPVLARATEDDDDASGRGGPAAVLPPMAWDFDPDLGTVDRDPLSGPGDADDAQSSRFRRFFSTTEGGAAPAASTTSAARPPAPANAGPPAPSSTSTTTTTTDPSHESLMAILLASRQQQQPQPQQQQSLQSQQTLQVAPPAGLPLARGWSDGQRGAAPTSSLQSELNEGSVVMEPQRPPVPMAAAPFGPDAHIRGAPPAFAGFATEVCALYAVRGHRMRSGPINQARHSSFNVLAI